MKALILVDIQNDFLPGGALAVPDGDAVISVVNKLQAAFPLVLATQDWHPANHGSFAASHPGKQVFQQIELNGLPQTLWPGHCVQNTKGADLADALDRNRIAKIFPKGTDAVIDSYSGLFDNGHRKSTGLGEWLKDPKAQTAALAVAEAAALAANQSVSTQEWLPSLIQLGHDEEWSEICYRLTSALASGKSVTEFADALALQNGVTGYAYHSVPIALYAWLRHPGDFRTGLEAALNCGGDTDTVGAIVGALLGAQVGAAGIPQEWLEGICDEPRSICLLTQVAERLTEQKTAKRALGPVTSMWPVLVIRNFVFLITVLIHGLRRLAPPY